MRFNFIIMICLAGLTACVNGKKDGPPTLFKLRSAAETGIDFVNQLDYTEELNTYTYKNFYSGGGVGLGDFNNDGLIDIFFSGNLVPNKLYVNKGNWKFVDVSASSGVSEKGMWTTGVSVVDVNGDGWLDFYLCKSGPPGGNRRHNELFINNGDLTFSEKSREYGLAFEGLSTHAAFFDFDKDGDLDCYLLNNSFRSIGGYDLRVNQRERPDSLGGNKLLRNDEGKFVDVSTHAGIYTSEIGFGLGVTIGDINKDGWEDVYVSNDFFERDYLYLNDHDGTFTESLELYMREISLGSMGADMADINNDALPEIFVTEMLPESDARLKTTTQFESWDKYNLSVKSGYYHQFSRNVLQLNNGDGTFSEISRYSGTHASDWSWGALIFDMDNDGFKDIFVANGIYKELLNQDYVNYAASPAVVQAISNKKASAITRLIDSIPSIPIANYAFRNNGDLTFTNKADDWGLGLPTHSNGAAYGDLDNDGDLDLVLNNVNMPSFAYENLSEQLLPENKTLTVILHGEKGNSFALGTKLTLKAAGQTIYHELAPMRGFMSTVDNRMHVGLGELKTIDSLLAEWPDGKTTTMTSVNAGQVIHLYQKDAGEKKILSKKRGVPIFKGAKLPGVDFVHRENDYVDFNRDRLLFNMVSNEGPCLCAGDIDGDGRDDFYIGGAKGQPGKLYLQKSGTFESTNSAVIEKNKESEDTDCTFFDANGDGMLDLYVASGGVEFSSSSPALLDRLYLNDGQGKFIKSPQLLPITTRFESTGTVAADDYDNDGDQDLFVGVRLRPFEYGVPGDGFILNNDGEGNFRNVTEIVAPQLVKSGLITDAKWVDVNNDSTKDLIIVGEWMSIKIFVNENGTFTDQSVTYGLSKTNGWYNSIATGDFNGDGFADFVVGNHGLNSRFRASETEPVSMYVKDFDQNGSIEHIITHFREGKSYPLVLRHDLVAQIPSLKKKYLRYRDYKEQAINDIFTNDQLQNAEILHAYSLETAVWMNTGKGTFVKHALPAKANLFPVYALHIDDFDGDNKPDILLAGNLSRAKPETGIYQAGYGLLLTGDGQGNFEAIPALVSGVSLTGDVRKFSKIKRGASIYILVAKSDDKMEVLNLSK